jgi:hypothetical protein
VENGKAKTFSRRIIGCAVIEVYWSTFKLPALPTNKVNTKLLINYLLVNSKKGGKGAGVISTDVGLNI